MMKPIRALGMIILICYFSLSSVLIDFCPSVFAKPLTENLATDTAISLPPAPSELTVSKLDYQRWNHLRWKDNAFNETGFIVERALDYSGDWWLEIARTGSNVTEFIDTKLAVPDFSLYRYRVKAYNAQGTSSPSNVQISSFAPYGKLFGYARDMSNPAIILPYAVVTIKPHVYGYGTHDYTTNADSTGYFEFPEVLRKVTSSGGQITWLTYTVFVNEVPSSEPISLRDPFIVRQDAFKP